MKKSLKILIILFVFTTFVSCFKIEKVPIEPRIKFEEFIYVDSVGFNHVLNGSLRFSFEDGDGNIGFGIDSIAENTVFIEKYKIKNNIPIRMEIDGSLLNFKIKQFSTSGNRRALRGDIVIKNLDEIFPINNDDTLMYKFYIQDRDKHVSNIDSTGFLPLRNFF